MNTAISVIYVAITVALAPFFAYLLLLTLAALLPRRGGPAGGAGRGGAAPRFLFVIPAHDEEAGIRATVESCAAAIYDPALRSVAVIADNCSDGTAEAARAAGAWVVERHDPLRKSKGHALEYFFETVAEARPDSGRYDAAVIVDADTAVDPGILGAFAAALGGGAEWIQAYYTVRNPDASWRTRLMTYAFSLYNGVWPRGLDRLGLSVGLKGNGMCFAAPALAAFPWRAYGLVEDAEFSQMLRMSGRRVRFLPGTKVYGEMVSRGSAAASQRKRWEAGRRSLRGKFLAPLLQSRAIGPLSKAMYAIDLAFPPLGTLALGLLAASSLPALAALGLGPAETARALAPAHLAMGATLALYLVSPVLAMGLPPRYLAGLLAAPYYLAWKLLTGLGRTPATWVRTRREG